MSKKSMVKYVLLCSIAATMSFTILTNEHLFITNKNKVDATKIEEKDKEIDKTREELEELEEKKKQLKQKIEITTGDLEAEEENKKAMEEQIKVVGESIEKLEDAIVMLNEKISKLSDEIDEKEEKIKEKEEEINDGIRSFKQRIRAMYMTGNKSYIELILGSANYYDLIMKLQFIKNIAEHDKNFIDNLIELKTELDKENEELKKLKESYESEKSDLLEQQQDHEEQKEYLKELCSKSGEVIEQLEKNKQKYVQDEDEFTEEQKEFEARLQRLYAEREQIKEAGYANGKVYSNDEFGYTGKSGSIFTWPCPGFYNVTFGFGPRTLFGSENHKGIDIMSNGIRGANICAAADGTVILAENNCFHDYGKSNNCCGSGYGNYCIIDHGNGYTTLYGHSEHISVKVGQKVKKGEKIGTVGSTGHSTGPHLHFEVRVNNVPVNPRNYV